jgi:hypothetical protein
LKKEKIYLEEICANTAIKTGRPNNVSIVIVDLRSRAALQETVKFIRG